jgi:site-specific DNA recombinase
MSRRTSRPAAATTTATRRVIRCASYSRKSTDEGLDRDFTTLDAQREACEAYIASQQHEGWVALPTRYDDGGFSGATLDRPAMQRLLADIEAGEIDALVCYKLDRVSRSLLDFLNLMEFLDRHHVALVSVTQAIRTDTSMGRLMLSVLAAFGAYERELIAERTRDKMSAARRKGKWTGGMPVLGYDVHPDGGKLLVNEEEAKQVRALFRLYLTHLSLRLVVEEALARGWTTKSWRTRDGRWHAGAPLNKSHLHHLLTNVLYIGQVNHHGTVYPGEQPAIIDAETFTEVQRLLTSRGRAYTHTLPEGLLKGLLTCAACDTAMIQTHAKKGETRYRYYTCTNAQKRGVAHCATRSVPAEALEGAVLTHLQQVAQEPVLLQQAMGPAAESPSITAKEIGAVLTHILPIWDTLFPVERRRVLQQMLESIDYHGGTGTLGLTLSPQGLRRLHDEMTASQEASNP